MTSRIRIFITALLLSHLLLLLSLVHAQSSEQQAAPATQQTTAHLLTGEEVTIYAKTLEKQGNVYTLKGDVEIDYRTYVLRAEEITYDQDSGDVNATGKVVLDGPLSLARQPVSGVFNTGDTDAFVSAVQGLFDLQRTPAPDGSLRLGPRPQPPA